MADESRTFLASIVAMAFCAGSGCSADPYADKVSTKDERVMRAMVDIACKLGVERLVISDKPAIARPSQSHETGGRNIQFGMDLDRRIAREAHWPRGRVCAVARVVADSSIKTVLANDTQSWEKFIEAFDGARSLMRISLPVYSQDGKRAVIYTESTCPYTCAGGFYHELEKTYSGWRIIGSLNAWTA